MTHDNKVTPVESTARLRALAKWQRLFAEEAQGEERAARLELADYLEHQAEQAERLLEGLTKPDSPELPRPQNKT